MASNKGVFRWSRENADFDLRVCAGKSWEFFFEEGAWIIRSVMCLARKMDIDGAYSMPLELPAQSQ